MIVKNLSAFAEALSARKASVALVMAPDRADQRKALSLLQKESTLLFMQGGEFSKETFLQESEQRDLFFKNKLLVIEEAHLLKKEEQALLGAYIEKPQGHITLVLLASEGFSSPKLVQQIGKEGIVLNLLEEKSWDKKARLIHEVLYYLKKQAIVMESRLCAEFVEGQGLDQSMLYHELDKLICYIGDRREITKEDVVAISTTLFQQTIWNLIDAIFQRKSGEALMMGRALLVESTLYHLLATLRSQMRNAIDILSLYQKEGKTAVTGRYAYLKGNLLENKLLLLQGYGMDALTRTAPLFFETELQVRDGNKDEELILEVLLIRLCTQTSCLC